MSLEVKEIEQRLAALREPLPERPLFAFFLWALLALYVAIGAYPILAYFLEYR